MLRQIKMVGITSVIIKSYKETSVFINTGIKLLLQISINIEYLGHSLSYLKNLKESFGFIIGPDVFE